MSTSACSTRSRTSASDVRAGPTACANSNRCVTSCRATYARNSVAGGSSRARSARCSATTNSSGPDRAAGPGRTARARAARASPSAVPTCAPISSGASVPISWPEHRPAIRRSACPGPAIDPSRRSIGAIGRRPVGRHPTAGKAAAHAATRPLAPAMRLDGRGELRGNRSIMSRAIADVRLDPLARARRSHLGQVRRHRQRREVRHRRARRARTASVQRRDAPASAGSGSS